MKKRKQKTIRSFFVAAVVEHSHAITPSFVPRESKNVLFDLVGRLRELIIINERTKQ